MPSVIPEELRRLQIDLPACPRTLIELQTLLAQPDVHAQACADVIAADMALAAEVIQTVNSAMFGLLRRVDHVGEALRYLGTDQVAAITLQAALRRAFKPTPLMERIWERAAILGWVMGRAARGLGVEPWLAHSAGLFALSGMAVFAARDDLFPQGYARICDAHVARPAEQAEAEHALIGLGHHAVGSALCARWGLSIQVVRYVRARATSVDGWVSQDLAVRRLLVLGDAVERRWADASAPLPGVALIESCGWQDDQLAGAIQPHLDSARVARLDDGSAHP
jgi:HD-like signal output (HDOD) protein